MRRSKWRGFLTRKTSAHRRHIAEITNTTGRNRGGWWLLVRQRGSAGCFWITFKSNFHKEAEPLTIIRVENTRLGITIESTRLVVFRGNYFLFNSLTWNWKVFVQAFIIVVVNEGNGAVIFNFEVFVFEVASLNFASLI